MTTLTIQIPDSKTNEIKSYLKSQGVVIASKISETKKSSALKDLELGLKQVKDYQNGKGKMYTLSELLSGK